MAGMGSKNNIKFNFEITEDNFIGKALPIQHDTHNTSKDHKFDIEFPIGFDDFQEITPLSFSDAEVMNYNCNGLICLAYFVQNLIFQGFPIIQQSRQNVL